jgi:hypothetical protein
LLREVCERTLISSTPRSLLVDLPALEEATEGHCREH